MLETMRQSVLAAEQRRCAAMLENDHAALAALLDSRLYFSHATGAVDGKEAFLAKMAAGRIQYVAIAQAEEEVTELAPGAALLTLRMTTDVRVEGIEKRLNNRVMTVWRQADGCWRLLAFQSTPLAA